LAELDADVEWHPAIEPGLRDRQLPTEVMTARERFWRQDRGEAWERLTNRPQEFRDLGETVLALGHMDLTARATGMEFSQEVGEVFDLRAGKIVRIRDFLTHAEALEAAGLRE
jgi:ketosteroid isomerase-like protein